jgi:protocatechuate 3,4-dioxygenase beta subunit
MTGAHDDHHDDQGGFGRDVPLLLGRRRALALLGGAGLAGLVAACSGGDDAGPDGSATSTSTSTGAGGSSTTSGGSGAEIPDETAGPFPADGTNGPDILDVDGVVRSDITSSIGDRSGTAEGVPMVIELTVVEASTGAALPGAAVYLWHCTADGRYSIYEVEDQNYLRGVQEAGADGTVTFTSVFPGCYPGRWPHAHFEVFDELGTAASGRDAGKTSQFALPQADCEAVYGDRRYGSSASNLSGLSLEGDGIFRDGYDDQLATMTGSPEDGYTATLLLRV